VVKSLTGSSVSAGGRAIEPSEAATVERIFQEYDDSCAGEPRLWIELKAMLAAGQQKKQSPGTGEPLRGDSIGCGGPQPAEFGVLLERGLKRPQFRRPSDILPRDA
jgi:hypothetical protein